jgi:hypothetical protein
MNQLASGFLMVHGGLGEEGEEEGVGRMAEI